VTTKYENKKQLQLAKFLFELVITYCWYAKKECVSTCIIISMPRNMI